MTDVLTAISSGLQNGEDQQVADLTAEAIAASLPAQDILNQGLIGGMKVVGEKFRKHEIFLPDVLLAARAMHAGLNLIKPLLVADEVPVIGKVVMGTVRGDQHDIGKNLVAIMLEGAGYEVTDLGTNVSPAAFLAAAEQTGATVIGMSALLTTTMPAMAEVVEMVGQGNLAGRVRTLVGGAPVTADFASQIGADAFAYDGVSAVQAVTELVEGGAQ